MILAQPNVSSTHVSYFKIWPAPVLIFHSHTERWLQLIIHSELSIWKWCTQISDFWLQGSSIIWTSITVILAMPEFLKNSKKFDYHDFLRINPRNTAIPIVEDWDFFFRLSGTFSGPNHPDNRRPTVPSWDEHKVLNKIFFSFFHIFRPFLGWFFKVEHTKGAVEL